MNKRGGIYGVRAAYVEEEELIKHRIWEERNT